MLSDWDYFSRALCNSAMEIGHHYFEVKRENAKPVWRERAYCYELYHQLRCQLDGESKFDYTLHGEIDKKNHEEVCKEFKKIMKGCPNPDFVVHVPGDDKNLVVIEVKTFEHIRYAYLDLKKLNVFLNSGLHYEHGILLIFGSNQKKSAKDETIEEGLKKLAKDYKCDEQKLCILWHKKCGKLPERIFGSYPAHKINNF
jgi:hypothetical protein